MKRARAWSVVSRALVGAGVLAALAALVAYLALTWDLPDVRSLAERKPAPSNLIVDRQGRLLYEVINPQVGKHVPVRLSQVPLALRQATVATEDARFGQHHGVDFVAVARALWSNLRAGEIVSGGSTITQQVARILLMSDAERQERTVLRKAREAVLAWRLQRAYSDDEILELYLNHAYYGHYARGVEAAAQAYFGKHVSELDVAESVLLAGLPQSPALYNPLENPEAAKERQATVVRLMLQRGYLSPEQAETAKAEELRFVATPFPIEAPHFVMYVQRLLETQFDPELVSGGGLVIHTTLDLALNQEAERIVRYHLSRLTTPGDDNPQRRVDNSALLALDPRSGEVLAMVGSPDYFDRQISGAVNGTLTLRQPGSAIKPLTYAAAFDPSRATDARPPLTAATLVEDVRTPFVTREGDPYVPLNYDRRFRGPVLLRQALGSSLNIPAVKVLDYVGLDALLTMAYDLGITSLGGSQDYGLSLTLGGGELSLLELTRAYGAFAGLGQAQRTVAITQITDLQGEVLWSHQPTAARAALDPRVAYLMTDILSDSYARLSGFGDAPALRLSRPAAVKTGTTTDWRDNWTVGYTPQLVTGVWVGNADNQPMYSVSGVSGAAPIWHDFMELAHRGQSVLPFARPDGLVEVSVCAESGSLPGSHCPLSRSELFIEGTEPQHLCTVHDQGAQRLAKADRAWSNWEGAAPGAAPVMAALPELARAAHPEMGGPALLISSPDPQARYRLNSALPAESQRIPLVVRLPYGSAPLRVTLWVDGAVWQVFDGPPYEGWWPLQPGQHRVQAVAHDGTGAQWASPVVIFGVTEP